MTPPTVPHSWLLVRDLGTPLTPVRYCVRCLKRYYWKPLTGVFSSDPHILTEGIFNKEITPLRQWPLGNFTNCKLAQRKFAVGQGKQREFENTIWVGTLFSVNTWLGLYFWVSSCNQGPCWLNKSRQSLSYFFTCQEWQLYWVFIMIRCVISLRTEATKVKLSLKKVENQKNGSCEVNTMR